MQQRTGGVSILRWTCSIKDDSRIILVEVLWL